MTTRSKFMGLFGRSSARTQRVKRRKGTSAGKRRLGFALLKWALLGGLALAAIGSVTLAGLFWYWGSDADLPTFSSVTDYKPKLVTHIEATDGTLVGEIYQQRRSSVALADISPLMVQAIIDSEDADFRNHKGLDFMGMMRAFWVNLRSGSTKQGASTITQQVCKTLLLTHERTLKRKIQEIILARRLENALDKDEILTLYLNQVYFGHGRYGIEEATRFFFGKSAKELNLGEAALMAGLVQSPERLSPVKHPEAAKRRQMYVLGQMVKRGHVSEEEGNRWASEPIRIVRNSAPHLGTAPELVDLVKNELKKRYGDQDMGSLGLRVRTTIDAKLQAAARAALESGLRALDERHKYRGPKKRLKPKQAERMLKKLAKATGGKKPSEAKSYDALVISVSDETEEMIVDLGGFRGAVLLHGGQDTRYNPDKKKPSERFAKNDLVRVRRSPRLGKPATEGMVHAFMLAQGPQAALIAIDPKTRHVVAMIGGYNFLPGNFNRVMRAKRQPGSSFKPFVYATAIDSGTHTAATIVNDAPEVYDLWKPKNYDAKNFRGPIRLREALANSINSVAIRVMHDVGPPRVVALAHDLGIKSELPAELSLALGSGVVTPLELVNAYATIAAGGMYAPPVFFTELGDDPVEPEPPVQAMRPEVAYVITSMMQSVVQEGTARRARSLRRPIAGKTGTSNAARDAWFVGFTPELVVGVWVGFDDMRPLGRKEAGGRAALPIWIEFVKEALKGKPAGVFRPPPGVITARIDRATGLLAAPGQPPDQIIDEVFLDGSVPTEVATQSDEVDPTQFLLDTMNEEAMGAP